MSSTVVPQANAIPRPPIIPNCRKPRNCMATSDA